MAIQGARLLTQIILQPPPGVKKLAPAVQLTPFQKLLLQRLDLADRLETAVGMHAEANHDGGNVQLQLEGYGRSIETASVRLRSAEQALEQHDATRGTTENELAEVSERLQGINERLRTSNAAIAELNAALEPFERKEAPDTVLEADQGRLETTQQTRDDFQEQIDLLSRHLSVTQRAIPSLTESLELLDSGRAGLVAEKDQATDTLRRERESQGVAQGLLATYTRKSDNATSARAALGEEIDRIDVEIEALSPAAKLAMGREAALEAHTVTTADDIVTLREAARLIDVEILGILEEGRLYAAYRGTLGEIRSRAHDATVVLYETRLDAIEQNARSAKAKGIDSARLQSILTTYLDLETSVPEGFGELGTLNKDLQIIEITLTAIGSIVQRLQVFHQKTGHAPAEARAKVIDEKRKSLVTLQAHLQKVKEECDKALAAEKVLLPTEEAPLSAYRVTYTLAVTKPDTLKIDTIHGELNNLRAAEAILAQAVAIWEEADAKFQDVHPFKAAKIVRKAAALKVIRDLIIEKTPAAPAKAAPKRRPARAMPAAAPESRPAYSREMPVVTVTAEEINKNAVMRNIIDEYLKGNDHPDFPRKAHVGTNTITMPDIVDSVPRSDVALLMTAYAANPKEVRENFVGSRKEGAQINGFIRRCVTRLEGHRERYLAAAEELFTLLDRATESELPPPAAPPAKTPLQTATAAEREALEADLNHHTVSTVFNTAQAEGAVTRLANLNTESLLQSLEVMAKVCGIWTIEKQANPTDSNILAMQVSRSSMRENVLEAIRKRVAILAGEINPKLAAVVTELNKEENKEVRRIMLGYLIYQEEERFPFPTDQSPLPYRLKGGKGSLEPDAKNDVITVQQAQDFLTKYAGERKSPDIVKAMIKRAVSRQRNLRGHYQTKALEVFTVLETLAEAIPNPKQTDLRGVLIRQLYSRIERNQLQWLAMPKTNGNGTQRVTSADDFYAYVDAYLENPLACVRAENQALATYYKGLERQKAGGVWGKLGRKTGELTTESQAEFDRVVKEAVLTRVKIESALFPNGQRASLSADDVTGKNYAQEQDYTYVYQNYAMPPVIEAQLGQVEVAPHAELVARVNKSSRDSRGDEAVVFDFLVRAKTRTILSLACGNPDTGLGAATVAKAIFEDLNQSYSEKQEPEDVSITGQNLTQNFFMVQGGCCRHRSMVLQLGYQEAGIRSTIFLGFTSYADHFPKQLAGGHAWIMLDPFNQGNWSHLADPNRIYNSQDINARFFGPVADRTKVEGWHPSNYPELFDGNTHIFNFKSMSDTYWNITGQKREEDHQLDYYVAEERFNFIWSPHLAIDRGQLQAELKQA